jgi:DNA mismatch repair ATPase MutS
MKIYYSEKITSLSKLENRLAEKGIKFTYARLSTFLAFFGFMYAYRETPFELIYSLPFLGVLFFTLIFFHNKVKQKREDTKTHRDVLKNEISCLESYENSFYNGEIYSDNLHPFSSDLDVFGEFSLYHFINRSSTPSGKNKLAHFLKDSDSSESIQKRQKSVQELSKKPDFMQRFLINSFNFSSDNNTFNISEWFKFPKYFGNLKNALFIHYTLPIIFFMIVYIAFVDLSNLKILFGAVLVNSLFYASFRKKISGLYSETDKLSDLLKTYSSLLKTIESESFDDVSLQKMKTDLFTEKSSPSVAIDELSNIIHNLNYRLSSMGIVLNVTMLWEMLFVAKLEQWKSKHQESVLKWLDCVGEFEALISLGTLSFNHKEWAFPIITAYTSLNGTGLGHPLILNSDRVNNPVLINEDKKLHIVTGSNMAGKSTYLRTIGINQVLALAGAPVCAKTFSTPNIKMITFMRIKDSVKDQTSTFYAEIKRLKQVLDEVASETPTLVLLDEILRGTNSKDKHDGSKAIIERLLTENALTMIATHDLELSKLEQDYPEKISNFYFDINVVGEELSFDYKLKSGVCKTMNAKLLLKKIGIES